jgi:hypothetical protein
MRYTDEKINEALKQPVTITEDVASHSYQDTLDSGISIEIINEPKGVWVNSHDDITLKYAIDVEWGRFGVKGIHLTVQAMNPFNITYVVEEEGKTEAEENEEEVDEVSFDPVTVSCTEIPCNLQSFNWRITIDYNTNKVVGFAQD